MLATIQKILSLFWEDFDLLLKMMISKIIYLNLATGDTAFSST